MSHAGKCHFVWSLDRRGEVSRAGKCHLLYERGEVSGGENTGREVSHGEVPSHPTGMSEIDFWPIPVLFFGTAQDFKDISLPFSLVPFCQKNPIKALAYLTSLSDRKKKRVLRH